MPRTKKPAGQAVDRRNGRRAELVALPGSRLDLPDPPEGVTWTADAVQAWNRFWDDPVAQALTPADEHLTVRWLEALNRFLILSRSADRSPLRTGSMGQDVLNPLYRAADGALRTVQACEKQLGIGPAHRASLGIAMITEKRTLADLNTTFREVSHADDDQDQDPRLIQG